MNVPTNAKIFDRLLFSDALQIPPQASMWAIYLFLRVGQLRKMFAKFLTKLGIKTGKDPLTWKTQHCVRDSLTILCELSNTVAELVVRFADQLLYDRLVLQLREMADPERILRLILICNKEGGDPTDDAIAISKLLNLQPWLLEMYLTNEDHVGGLSLAEVREILLFTEGKHYTDLQPIVKEHKFRNVRQRYNEHVKTHVVISDDTKTKMEKFVNKTLLDEPELKLYFDEVEKISKVWASTWNEYSDRPLTNLLAAKILIKDAKALHYQLESGNGKTFLNLLVGQHQLQ